MGDLRGSWNPWKINAKMAKIDVQLPDLGLTIEGK